jgi:signal transduction histidine kinase
VDRMATEPRALLKVSPGRGELEFHFTALSFCAPEKNQYKYLLEGVDNDWAEAGNRSVAYYNNISPGNYRFRVAAANNDGVWNETGTSIAFVMLPHFWQTVWFKLAIAGALVAALTLVYRLRVARLREIERLRVRIAADLHDEVGSSLWSISLLSGMLKKNEQLPPEERRDADEINRIALQSAAAVRDIVWFIKPEYDTMQDMVLRMRDVAATMLGGMEHRFNNAQSDMSRRLPIDFRQNVFLMFKEILTNVARHSQATFVEIEISESAGLWRMQIRDNGIGFDPDAAFSGNGMKNLRSRAEKLKGTLEVKTQRGCGTTITFSVQHG